MVVVGIHLKLKILQRNKVMKAKNSHCIRCEALGRKRAKKADIHVKENGVDIPLCHECHEEWLLEQEFTINLREENDGSELQGT